LKGADVLLWTNGRVTEWLRLVELAEYAPNLRGSGVHGALMVRTFKEFITGLAQNNHAELVWVPQKTNLKSLPHNRVNSSSNLTEIACNLPSPWMHPHCCWCLMAVIQTNQIAFC